MAGLPENDMEMDASDESFTQACDHVQRTHNAYTPNDLLELYGLYKQATSGRCDTTKPGIFNMQSRAKWSAWNDLGEMAQTDAKRLYVEKVRQLAPDWHAAMVKGEKITSTIGWVVHSTEIPPVDLFAKADHEKDVFDYVKEGDLTRLCTNWTLEQSHLLDDNGMGLLHWATDRNDLAIVAFLIETGADINIRDAELQTALHYASSCGHFDCIRLLLASGADHTLRDANGQTCFDVADSDDVRALFKM